MTKIAQFVIALLSATPLLAQPAAVLPTPHLRPPFPATRYGPVFSMARELIQHSGRFVGGGLILAPTARSGAGASAEVRFPDENVNPRGGRFVLARDAAIQDGFGDAVNVQDFGAVCDGFTDAAPALRAAIATGRSVTRLEPRLASKADFGAPTMVRESPLPCSP